MSVFGFIGVGNMGGALARAVCKAVGASNILVSDYSAEKAQAFADELGCAAVDNDTVVEKAKWIFLGADQNQHRQHQRRHKHRSKALSVNLFYPFLHLKMPHLHLLSNRASDVRNHNRP